MGAASLSATGTSRATSAARRLLLALGFCLDQWTEITAAVGGASEQSVVEAFVFAIRACGNTVCVASPGFDSPYALGRLWCAAEVYVSVCVGAQCFFSLPGRERPAFDELVYEELPSLVRRVVHGADVREAETSESADKAMLLKWLRSGQRQWGLEASKDLSFVNRAVASALRAFLIQATRRVMAARRVGGGGAETPGGAAEGAQEARSGGAVGTSGNDNPADLPIMRGYAMLLEEQGRNGVGGARGCVSS